MYDATQKTISQMIVEDLQKSGLTVSDIAARDIEMAERAVTRTPGSVSGYVIPYRDIFGRPLTHYRVRLFDDPNARYRQPKESSTYVYFPAGFMKVARAQRDYALQSMPPLKHVVFVTEGEKKAALACKMGFPCIGLGGVEAWRNRIIKLPGETELSEKGNKITAKVASGMEASEETSSLAVGMQDFIDYVLQVDATIIIVFDSDVITGVQPQVQKAAATLGFELRSRGIPFANIRQIILPINSEGEVDEEGKLGLDDFLLMDGGYETFGALVNACLAKETAFPRHPGIHDYVGKRLQKPRLSRKECQQVALAILSDLDATGKRLRNKDSKSLYYFDNSTKALMEAGFLYGLSDEGHENPFGGLLYRRYGLSVADQKVLTWLSAQFHAELPLLEVSPERVIGKSRRDLDPTPNVMRYQLSDGQYVEVTSTNISICDNGRNGVLFESGHVAPISKDDLLREVRKLAREMNVPNEKGGWMPYINWWDICLSDTRIKDHGGMRKIHALLYYLAPWLNRWQGMQLPIEMALGESGSGKSTLFSLRLTILTGDPRLRNSPSDIKDWHASIVNAGGLHVTDNVQMSDPSLRQKLSDELCRLVTEPTPFVEQRQYYTNAGIVRFPIKPTFALTAIRQPFTNADLMQRSFIIELDKPATGDVVSFDMDWTRNMLEAVGGRAAWVAHHLLVIQRFFQLVEKRWNPNYRAKHRLVHLEQSLCIMAQVFGWDHDWIPNYLVGTTEELIVHADWAFEGVMAFVEEQRTLLDAAARLPSQKQPTPFVFASDIATWAQDSDQYMDCEILKNNRKLGRWLHDHKSMLAQVCGLVVEGTYANRVRYRILKTSELPKRNIVKPGTALASEYADLKGKRQTADQYLRTMTLAKRGPQP
jgi:hypothetical protein